MRLDGADDHEVAPSVPLPPDGIQFSPDWSPDGMRIAFGADDASGDDTRDLWVADVGKADAVRVFDCVRPCDQIGAPAWSPDGGSIAYTTWDIVGSNVVRQRIDSFDLETGVSKTLATATGAVWLDEARWSFDGRSLVFELSQWTDTSISNTRTASAIGVVDLTAAHPEARRLTDWRLWATYLDWHPTKDLIVFSTRPWSALDLGPSNLYTIGPDGSEMTPLTDFTAGQSRAAQPSWTPDGKGIMFTKVEGTGFGNPTMAVIDADGTGLRSAIGAVWHVGTHPRLRPQPRRRIGASAAQAGGTAGCGTAGDAVRTDGALMAGADVGVALLHAATVSAAIATTRTHVEAPYGSRRCQLGGQRTM